MWTEVAFFLKEWAPPQHLGEVEVTPETVIDWESLKETECLQGGRNCGLAVKEKDELQEAQEEAACECKVQGTVEEEKICWRMSCLSKVLKKR